MARRTDRLTAVVRKSYWREAERRAVVTAWRRSGKSPSRFARAHGARLEVVLVDGRRVRVPEGFAAEDLARVLTVLAGGA